MPLAEDAVPEAARRRELLIVAVLGTVTFSGPLAVHFFLPAIPHLKQEFGVGSAVAQAAFSVTLFVMALATLVYGTASDRLGRRAVLTSGLALFIAGSAICALSGSMATLIAGRLVQAFGAACGMVLARAIAYDIYGAGGAVRILAWLTMAYSLGPMIAPPIGGLLVDGIGWRAIFASAAVAIALTLALALIVLPVGGRPAAPASGRRETILRGYTRLFGSLRFCGFVLTPGLGSGAFFAYAAASTFVMSEILHRPAGEYGFYFLFCPVGYWFGTLAAGRLGGRAAIEIMVALGASVTFLATVGLGAIVVFGWLTPLALFVPGFFITFGQGMLLPNAQAGAIGADPSLAGTASGISVFLQLFLGAATSQLTGLLADGTAYPMAAVVFVAASLEMIAATLAWLARRPIAGT